MRLRRALVPAMAALLAAAFAVAAAAESRGAFELFTQHGGRFTERDLVGGPTALFFGFTSCPDICPTTLMELSTDLQALGADGDRLKVVFVSVDPERDTQARLQDYVSSFDPRIIALSGAPDAIAAVARAYGARYRRVPTGSGYTFDHTAAVFLLDRRGETSAVLNTGELQPQRLGKLRDLLR